MLIFNASCRDSETEDIGELPSNQQLGFSSQPIQKRSFFDATSEPLNDYDRASKLFKGQLQQLTEFANEIRRGESGTKPPDILADQFETAILERDRLRSAFLGERIRIARWRLSEKTPTFYDSIALNRLFETLLQPWLEASRCQIEFTVHTVRDRPNYYDAQVLLNITGSVPTNTVRDGGNNEQIGRSAIGIWQVIWQKGEGKGPPRIKKINMIGHEETVNYLPNGQLFSDCTASVLRNDPKTIDTLSYGLDQWAKRIPGLDVVGDCGLAIGDINNDGMDDIYVCQPHSMPNLLLRQNPDGTADEIAASAGVNLFDDSKAALLVDIDNDRKQDLVVATESRLVLFSNAGDGKFLLEHQLKIGPGTESITAADYDNDGDLDLFLAKYRPVARFSDIFPHPNTNINAINGGRNILLRNDEAWSFKDITSDVGISMSNSNYTNAAIWNDFDSDGDLDLYLANDFQRDNLYVNDKGWFTDSFKSKLTKNTGNSSTVSIADLDRDGQPDFLVGSNSSFATQRITQDYIDSGGKLLREANGFGAENQFVSSMGSGKINHYQFLAPIFASESSYGSVSGDWNNDGFEDFAISNGWLSRREQQDVESRMLRHLFDPSKDLDIISKKDLFSIHHEISDLCRQGASYNGFQRNSCFLTIGSKRFANYSNSSGMDFLDDARGIARTDWDGDGDIDLVVTNRTAPRLRILKNQFESRNQFINIRLRGTKSNRDAIGSRVEVFLRGSNSPLVRMLTAGSGRKAQSSKVLHFGLGRSPGIEKLIVHWPNGEPQIFTEISTNKTYVLVEGQEQPAEYTNARYRIALADKPITAKTGLPKTERIRFFPTARLPIIQFRGTVEKRREKWYQVENVVDRPLVCIFLPSNHDYTDLLVQWNSRRQEIVKMNADMLAVFTGNNVDKDRKLVPYVEQIEAAGFDFRWGVLSESSNSKFAHCLGEWFFDFELPARPMVFLFDAEGNIHFAYAHDQMDWETIKGDLQNLSDRNFVLNRIPEHEDEFWASTKRTPRFDRLHLRYRESGYDRDAAYMEPWLESLQSDNYLRRAIDLAAKGNLASALTSVERSSEINPQSIEAMITHADILVQYSETADQQARTRMLQTAGELLDQAILEEPANAEAILARAEIFRLQNDIENALNLLTKFLQIDPESWETHAIIGRLYFHKRDRFEATKHLIAAYDNRPKLPYVAGDLGVLYLKHRQFQDAKEFLDLAARLQPSEKNTRRHLAEAEFWLNNFERAGELFEQTVTTESTLTHSKQMLAWLKAASPFSNFRDGNQGLKIIEPFVDLRGDQSPASLEIMAACYAEIGDFENALVYQKRAVGAVENLKGAEAYNELQVDSMRNRLELYKRQRKYRIKDASESPLLLLGDPQE